MHSNFLISVKTNRNIDAQCVDIYSPILGHKTLFLADFQTSVTGICSLKTFLIENSSCHATYCTEKSSILDYSNVKWGLDCVP